MTLQSVCKVSFMSKQNYYYTGDCGPNYFAECRAAFWIWRILPITLLAIGTFGNILNVIVLSRKQLRKYSTTTFLLALAITELTVLWTALVPDTVISLTGSRIVDMSPVTCRLRWWLALTSGSYSTWILVLLTMERTLLTKAPAFSKRKVTPRNALIVCLIVLFVIAALNSHMIFGMRLHDIPAIDHLGQNFTASIPPFRCYFSSVEYEFFYFQYWNTIIMAIYNVIPAGIIVVGNINIAVVLLLQRKNIARVNPSTHPGYYVRRKSSAKILFILSVFYILTTTPWSVYYLLKGKIVDHTDQEFSRWQLATAIVSTLLYCNFSFNFFFYFVSGTLFKSEWRGLIERARNNFENLLPTTFRSRS